MNRRRHRGSSSNKFWDKLGGKSFTRTYGKIGTDGQTTIESFASPAVGE